MEKRGKIKRRKWKTNSTDGTAERILAETISSDVALLVTFNQSIESVIQNNQKARANPKALAQLDGYKDRWSAPLSANLQRFGMERVAKVESLQEIIEEMREADGGNEKGGRAGVRHNSLYNQSAFPRRTPRQHHTDVRLIAPEELRHLTYLVTVFADQ
jgi:hypothetical protein